MIIATKLHWEQYEVIYRDGGFILKGSFHYYWSLLEDRSDYSNQTKLGAV